MLLKKWVEVLVHVEWRRSSASNARVSPICTLSPIPYYRLRRRHQRGLHLRHLKDNRSVLLNICRYSDLSPNPHIQLRTMTSSGLSLQAIEDVIRTQLWTQTTIKRSECDVSRYGMNATHKLALIRSITQRLELALCLSEGNRPFTLSERPFTMISW